MQQDGGRLTMTRRKNEAIVVKLGNLRVRIIVDRNVDVTVEAPRCVTVVREELERR